ncbi:MAG: cupin domain-containing protein [Terriglobia bacterium]
MADRFRKLLEPLETDEFWARYWGREHLHLRRDGAEYDSCLRIEDLDILLQSGQLPAAFLNVVTDGVLHPVEEWSRIRDSARGSDRVIQPERLFDFYLKGATLILNQAHHSIPRLAELCRQLAVEMGFPVHANIYITPPAAQGFALHTDYHEVFVLQIGGAKCWRLVPAGDAAGIRIEMRAGDLLYIPRGLPHEAISQDSSSIHVTLGFYAVYPFELLTDLAAKAGSDSRFQQPFTPGKDADERGFQNAVTELLGETTAAEMRSLRFGTFVKEQAPGWPGRLSDVLGLTGITLETVVCARPGIARKVTKAGKSIEVEFAEQKLTVPAFMGKCLDRMLTGEPFATKELQGMITDSGRIELVKKFVQAGFLTLSR